ncbi:hypothetical protein ACHAL6_00675 [Proteiniclasticum sp. C24MP]|uniref:hypothetical protein n=1 Tax=Proteiniclasticum sp. C24MP TaxID=3374101 RepID=UPI003754340A
MKKKIKKRYRYKPQNLPAKVQEGPKVNTSKPIWGYSPTGRIVCEDPMRTQTPMRAFEQTASRKSLSNFQDPSQVTPIVRMCGGCGGRGYLRAMQRASTLDGGSVRAKDRLIACSACHGTGRRPL